MDLTSLGSLIYCIARFSHLVTCCMSNTMPAEKDYRSIASFLKYLKPVLDDVAYYEGTLAEALCKECEELGFAIDETRVFLEKWSPKTSRILCVLESKPLFKKIHVSSVRLSCFLCRLCETWPTISNLSRAQFCIQESQNMNLGKPAEYVEEAFRRQKDGEIIGTEHFTRITESLDMKTKHDLLSEHIALEKERKKAEENRTKRDSDMISLALDLINHIRDFSVVKLENVQIINGIQIPPYFICPLSLEIMSDPVIIASGKTYDRTSIKKWLDHGLVTCPETHVNLSHKNLIPNFTVKELIASWCSENKFDLSNNRLDVVSNECHLKHIREEDDPRCPLEKREPKSNSSLGIQSCFEKKKVSVYPGLGRDDNHATIDEGEKCNQLSPDHSYIHSRSESASSAISSIEYLPVASSEISRMSTRKDGVSDKSRESPSLNEDRYCSSKTMSEMAANRSHNLFRKLSFSSVSVSDDLTTTTHVEKLIKDLKSESTELQTAAAGELRFLAKYNMENRIIIVRCGAIVPLISLLYSDISLAQEHAVTALLNLSINQNLRAKIAEEGVLDPLIHVLRNGNVVAKENGAATLFSISLLDDYRVKIGRSGAVKALVNLLGSDSLRGKKDAATALFNLSIFHENKARIIQAGAVKHLVALMDPSTEMVDKAVALLANLSTVTEGCSAIVREGAIPLLVDIVDAGSQRGKENSSSVLLQLCLNSPKYCHNILQEGAIPPLVALTQSGTPRAKEKAKQLLSHFRSQLESTTAKRRP